MFLVVGMGGEVGLSPCYFGNTRSVFILRGPGPRVYDPGFEKIGGGEGGPILSRGAQFDSIDRRRQAKLRRDPSVRST